ncbi:MAG TPA: hypothetical protein VFO76_02520, partial [Candidatus Kapabacteria bacterium]|nr:hypothetical protein [Candidatus Kapabacteria bacterium]
MSKLSKQKTLGFLLLVVSVATLGSCGFFRNFTTYFNVLYLAQRHLDLYEEQLKGEAVTKDAAVAAAFTHHWMEEELLTYEIRRKHGPPVVAFSLVSKPKVSL